MRRSIIERVKPLFTLALLLVAFGVLHRELRARSLSDVLTALHAFPVLSILQALAWAGLGYVSLIGYDILALRFLGKKVPVPRLALTSLVSYAISNNTGYSIITGSSIRFRFYNTSGLSGIDIIRFTLFCSLSYILGTTSLFVGTVISAWRLVTPAFPWFLLVRGLFATASAGLLAYWLTVFLRKRPFVIRNMEWSLPRPGMTLMQSLVGVVEMLFCALVLYTLIRVHIPLSFQSFLLVFLIAQLLGLSSQIPGGLGVFEGAFLFLAPEQDDRSVLLAALFLYRLIYYLIPLILAGIGLLGYELHQHRRQVVDTTQDMWNVLTRMVPHVFSMLLVLAGVILLISGATPNDFRMLTQIQHSLSLPIVEISHLTGSLVGLLLLLVARAVRRRLDVAYPAVLILLGLGMLASLFKGLDWQEALYLGVLFLLFLPTRHLFSRKSSLLETALSPKWLGFVSLMIAGSIWIGFFAYKHKAYSPALWWKFSYLGDAPRFLRSSLILVSTVILFALYRLIRVSPIRGELPSESELETLQSLVKQAPETQSHLALLGDKQVLWSSSRKGFLMYGITQKYWIGMGDPVGSPEEKEELIWQFREAADRVGAKVAFYQVSQNQLPLYLDLGLVLIKLGEEARVPLDRFDLTGKARSGLRQTNNKLSKTGVCFEVLEVDTVPERMSELRRVSDAWMETKNAKEKGFSLGFFSEGYVRKTRVGIATLDGKIVAFSNLWTLDSLEEMSLDLMRFSPDAPPNVMEYLLIQLILWGKEQGYHWFNLGMAPLAGLESRPLAPLWHKVGNIIFKHGENVYNFEGLHAYKEKFSPEWSPRFLAAPPMKAAGVLMQVTTIISGSLKGVFRK